MSDSYKTGQTVHWHWGSGTAEGKIEDRFEKRVQRTIKGTKVVKVGTKENPAYLISQENGTKVLKRGSELTG